MRVLNDNSDYLRMIEMLSYYQRENPPLRFSLFMDANKSHKLHRVGVNYNAGEKLVEIIAYCIMPTHLHILIKELKMRGLSVFLNKLLVSYTRYFNEKYNRKGTVWENRTKRKLIATDEQLLHLTRYIHLNPVTSYFVNKPEDWAPSSYREYISIVPECEKICDYRKIVPMPSVEYKRFVENGISYQREMAKLKNTDAV